MPRRPSVRPLLATLLLSLGCGPGSPLPAELEPDLDAPRVGLVGGPELPALVRDVHLTDADQHTQPVIPPFRTSADGRIAVDMKPRSPNVKFYLLGPEKLTEPVTAPGAPAGAEIVLERFTIPATEFYDASVYAANDPALDPEHRTICDATPQFGWGANTPRSPHFCDSTNPLYSDPAAATSGHDCYDLTVITTVQYTDAVDGRMVQLWGKPLTVVVEEPKRADLATPQVASVVWVDHSAPPVAGPSFHANSLLEPMVTNDGRLLVGRLGKSNRDPNDGSSRGGDRLDVVYGTYSELADPCDVTQWTELHPISHAYHDPQMQGRYGIAAYPLRDPHGVEIADGLDAQVSYPWIDRDGDNLFFTTLDATLFNDDGSGGLMQRYGASCYDAACTLPTTVAEADAFENQENFRGVGFAGLWSHGKMVLIDNAINNTDYGFGREDDEQVWLDLYDDPAGSIRVGTGRDNGNPVPAMSTANSAFIDSLEHLFNYHDALLPLTVRDVVWTLNTGKVSAELAFDDYLDPDAFILAEMSGALEHTGSGGVRMRYHDGFDQTAPGTVVAQGPGYLRFQNAATSLAWDVPAYGVPLGDVRLEPVAMGGIEGRGAWLDGTDDGISFTITDQSPAVVEDHAWYLGVFVDPRFDDDGQRRQLVVFPDGSQILLVGRSAIEYVDAAGTTTTTIALGGLALADGAWSHLGFGLDYPSNTTRLYLDGFPFAQTNAVVHHLDPGQLVLGDAPNDALPGVRGWVDELKLLAHEPSLEVACNHARGTLMAGNASVGEPWHSLAPQYPSGAHDAITSALAANGQPTFARYVCHHDYSEPLAANPRLPGTDPALTPIRESLLFPEGPLEFQVERPDSSANGFCLSCHTAAGAPGLDLSALDPGAPGVELQNDSRRQPMMPPRVIFGNVPAMLFGTGPLVDLSSTGHPIDQYVFPN